LRGWSIITMVPGTPGVTNGAAATRVEAMARFRAAWEKASRAGPALGTVAAPDQKAAEAEAVRAFHLNEEHKRLLRVGEAERDFTSHFDL
jgi:hypothetical protein